jgi:predicted phosphodiesterase
MQFNGLENILRRKEYQEMNKIIMIHHHFDKLPSLSNNNKLTLLQNIEGNSMKLKGKQKLIDLFIDHEVRLVLHGHTHESGEYWYKGIHFSGAGGSIDGNKSGELKINFIDIEDGKFEIDIRTLCVRRKNLESVYQQKKIVNSLSYI